MKAFYMWRFSTPHCKNELERTTNLCCWFILQVLFYYVVRKTSSFFFLCRFLIIYNTVPYKKVYCCIYICTFQDKPGPSNAADEDEDEDVDDDLPQFMNQSINSSSSIREISKSSLQLAYNIVSVSLLQLGEFMLLNPTMECKNRRKVYTKHFSKLRLGCITTVPSLKFSKYFLFRF